MGVLTAVTANEANFSIRSIEANESFVIQSNQQLTLNGQFIINEDSQLELEDFGELAII